MTVFILQIMAMTTMVCDHLGFAFFGDSVILRSIGRFAFPIYAFLLAEGFRHIKNDPARVSSHLKDYVFLALVSEFCYDFMECKPITFSEVICSQCAMITLLLAFLGLMAIEKWKDSPLYMWSAVFLTAMINYLVMSNFKLTGVLLVYAFYFYLNRMEGKSFIQKILFLEMIFLIYLPFYHWARYDFCSLPVYIEELTFANRCWYLAHALIPIPLALYSGSLGPTNKTFKKVYKYFYPAHMFVIGIIYHLVP